MGERRSPGRAAFGATLERWFVRPAAKVERGASGRTDGPAIDHLQETVLDLSDGALSIRVVPFPATIDEEQQDEEEQQQQQQTVAAVAAGDLDLAWVGTRAFSELGVARLDALTAPMLIDSYPLHEAVLASDIPERMLAGLDELDVVGLAVIGGGLRKPFASGSPLLSPDDFDGITFHTFHAEGNERAIAALGATQVDGNLATGVAEGTLTIDHAWSCIDASPR